MMTRPFRGAMLGSLFLHALAISGFEVGSGMQIAQPLPPVEPAIQLEFVDTLPSDKVLPVQDSKNISDHNSIARDASQDARDAAEPQPEVLKDDVRSLGQSPQKMSEPGYPNKAQDAGDQAPKHTAHEASDQSIAVHPADSVVQVTESSGSAQAEPVQRAVSPIESGVEHMGEVAFNARAHDIGPYVKDLKRKIWLEWFPLVEFKHSVIVQSGKTVVSFKIHRDGQVSDLRVLEHEGAEYLQAIGRSAVIGAAPFAPLPKDFKAIDGEETLDIIFSFYYY